MGAFFEEIQEGEPYLHPTALEDRIEYLSKLRDTRVVATCDAGRFLSLVRRGAGRTPMQGLDEAVEKQWFGRNDPFATTMVNMWYGDAKWDVCFLPNRALVTM